MKGDQYRPHPSLAAMHQDNSLSVSHPWIPSRDQMWGTTALGRPAGGRGTHREPEPPGGQLGRWGNQGQALWGTT